MGKWVHRLSDIVADNRTATCAHCGPHSKIKKHAAHQTGWRCSSPRYKNEPFIPGATRPMPTHCECCGLESSGVNMHRDHHTGLFRGWICSACNTSMGLLRDSVFRLQCCINYLSRTKENPPSVGNAGRVVAPSDEGPFGRAFCRSTSDCTIPACNLILSRV